MIYYCVNKAYPFTGETAEELITTYSKTVAPFDNASDEVSNNLKNFITELLQKDKSKRC